jgi:hypothetical protein
MDSLANGIAGLQKQVDATNTRLAQIQTEMNRVLDE